MEPLNQNAYATAERDRVNVGLGPKQNPTTGNRRAALPRDAGESTVSTPNDKPGKRKKSNAPTPQVPDAAIRDSRIGGTVALLCAAAISAQTLFALGRLIGLSPWTAWLLPAALDVYAMTSTRVAFQVPTGHAARSKAIWNARVALLFTISANCLYHAMHLAEGHNRWTPSDWALVGVSALPPIVVERLLHLQSIVTIGESAVETEPADRKASAPSSGSGERKPTPEARASNPPPPTASAGAAPASTARRVVPASGSGAGSRQAASGPIPIQRGARLEMIRNWIDAAGGDSAAVSLKEIQERFGVSQATASRMRTEATSPAEDTSSATAPTAAEDADDEPEQVLEATS